MATWAVAALAACTKETEWRSGTALFDRVPADVSGINFVNRVMPTDSINILTYEYLYNGGGVGIGDFNNDGYQDVFFAGSQVPGRLYINRGERKADNPGFTFDDVTANSGIIPDANWAFGVAVVDINDDGWQDIYISMGGPGNMNRFPNRLFVHQGLDPSGQPRFREMAEAYGLADRGQSIQALFLDYDRDGDLDMYQLTGGGFERSPNNPFPVVKDGSAVNTDRLYRNDESETGHPVFTDVSREAGILHEGYGLGVSLLDVNDDGWPDIYVTNDYLTNDHLYVNNGDGTFTDRIMEYFRHTSHFAMGNDAGDINNDGLIDIVAADMLPEDHARRKLMFGATQYNKFYYAVNHGYTHQYMRNTLQLNNGNGTFSEIGQLAGIHRTDWSWAVLFADLDNDEYQDLFITNGFGKDVTDLDFVKFRSSMTAEVRNEALRRKILLDSLAARPGIRLPNYAYRNEGNLRFSKVTDVWGFHTPSYSNGAAWADFDNDGDLDLVVSNIDEEAFLYRNNRREKYPSESNYLKIRLHASGRNKSGIGSTVKARYHNRIQVRNKSVVRGFQSTVEDNIHFGMGSVTSVDTLEVTWPDGKVTRLYDVATNQLVEVHDTLRIAPQPGEGREHTMFREYSSEVAPHRHLENPFVDFNHEPLLPHKLSQEGPGIAVADVNGDGRDDFFVGGALLRAGKLFLQQRDGSFLSREINREDVASEDTGCLFFDADNDGDADLYVVSGGNEYNPGHRHYQDRLYLNDGFGNFAKATDAVPQIEASGSCVTAADYDHDGDLDLFVGGRVLPTAYPRAPRSYLLRNNGRGVFEDVTEHLAPDLLHPGMVSAALWTDFDNDHWIDLVLVGEYMPVAIYRNEEGRKLARVGAPGLEHSEGWWRSVSAGDFDNDGDMDYIAGNHGLNSHYRATDAEPLSVTFGDFDNNGALEAITSYFEEGINYPTASLDVLAAQLPLIKRKILYHRTYANTSTEQLLEIAGKKVEGTLHCRTLESSFVENLGQGKFVLRPLPTALQTAPVYGVHVTDVNDDGNLDFLAVGNSYAPDVVSGRCDAFNGQVMCGDGRGGFRAMALAHSGFFVDGDAKGIATLAVGDRRLTLVSQNNDSLKVFSKEKMAHERMVRLKNKEVAATMTFSDGRSRKLESGYGDTYLSQSGRTLFLNSQVKKIVLYDAQGKATRTLTF